MMERCGSVECMRVLFLVADMYFSLQEHVMT